MEQHMKNLIICGNGDFARMLKYYVQTDGGRSVACFTVNREFVQDRTFCGLPLVPFEELATSYPPDSYEILMGVGYSKMNDVRKGLFRQCKEAGYDIASYIHSSCVVHTDDIGEGNVLLENCLVYPFVCIGDGNLMWDHVVISHDCVVGDFNTFAGSSDLSGYVTVGNNCFLGKGCVVRNGTTIADYTLIGATAYAKGKTNPYDVIVPARSVALQHKRSTDFL